MPRPPLGLFCVLLAGMVVVACAPLQTVPETAAVARQANARFELEGRLSATDGERAANGQILWEHTPTTDSWTASTPLGQILARLDSSPAGAELLLADGQRHHAPSANTLLPQLLGTEIPLEPLAGWVQASPGTGAEVRATDLHGRPVLVIDQGWRIDYAEYHDTSASALPRRLEISRGETRLRLVIDRWTLSP